MKLEESLSIFFSNNRIIALFANYVTLWKDICFILTLFINFIIITSYHDLGPITHDFWSSDEYRMD